MIISWFTQPPGSFASYYQYDTVTGEFSRTRLELGRTSSSSTNDTFVSYYPERYVGFSNKSYSTSNPSAHWSVNDKGQLCYDGNALPGKPSTGWGVYDSSDTSSFVHRGNPVTVKPELPTGIEAKHLTLLANDAFISGKKTILTDGSAKPAELVDALKTQVCRVLKVNDFNTITDDTILVKLTSQAKTISSLASHESVFNMDKALTAADDARYLISEQMDEGLLTPTNEFEDAFDSLESALENAQNASGESASQALTEIGKAQQALNTAINNIDANKYATVAKELNNASSSLDTAKQHANDWQQVDMEYEKLTAANTVDDYMEIMNDNM
jgi:hypothetical protein